MVASLVISSRSRRRTSVTSRTRMMAPVLVPPTIIGIARSWTTEPFPSTSAAPGARPAATTISDSFSGSSGATQPGGDHGQLRADEVGGQAEAPVGGLGVRAGVGDPAGPAQAQQPVAHPRRPDQQGRLAGERERPLGHHPGQVICALHVGELEPAGGAGRVQVGAPLDHGDDPARPGHRNALGPDRDAVGPVRVALPPDAPLGPGHVQQPLVPWAGHGPHHIVLERGRTGRRPHLGQRQPAAVIADRRPQDQVGEGQIGQQLPVRDQRVQPLHVAVTERGAAGRQVIQRRHSTIIASGARCIPHRGVRVGADVQCQS